MAEMDFIFMLTRRDQTVCDCLEVMETIRPLGLRHVGFKDVGVDPEVIRELHAQIKRSGATSYLEVVSTTQDSALTSAQMAAELGVDCLLGGTWVRETLSIIDGTGVRYFPFVGRPSGHPTRLGGTAQLVAKHCREAEAQGCAGVDLLAYRADDAAPLDLVREARAALTGKLIVAGSIERSDQIEALAELGADAFTIGSAAFAGAIEPTAGLLTSQLRAVQRQWLSSDQHGPSTEDETT